MKWFKRLLAAAGILLVLTGGVVYGGGCLYFREHFLPGTKVSGFDVSFKTVAETEEILNEEVLSYALAVDTRNGGREKLKAEQVGMKYQSTGEIRDQLKAQPFYQWVIPQKQSYSLVGGFKLDREKLVQAVSELKCANNMQAPVDARILKVDGKYQVIPEINGTQLELDQATMLIETALKRGDESVSLESCYKNPTVKADNKELSEKCNALNKMLQTIITYDFGDRSEFIDGSIAEEWVTEYELDKRKVYEYVEGLARKYDTCGAERKFVTYDDRKISLAGGEYGWKIDVEKETEKLYQLLWEGTITVRTPEYSHIALNREKNDIGFSYLEIDKTASKIVLYVEGKPLVENEILFMGNVPSGCNVLLSKEESLEDTRYLFSISQEIRILGVSPEKEATLKIQPFNTLTEAQCIISESCARSIYDAVQKNFPVIVY